MSDLHASAPSHETAGDYSTATAGLTIDDPADLAPRLEALLFASAGPASLSDLATALEVSKLQIEKALAALSETYAGRGIRIQRHRGGLQLTTAPEFAVEVERFLNLEQSSRLTRAALEVLAIVAYEQPVTRPQIDSIRGVNSDSVLKTLLRHGLIEETGRSEKPGRPFLYATTPEFLQHFGLGSLEELPPLMPETLPGSEAEEVAPLPGGPLPEG